MTFLTAERQEVRKKGREREGEQGSETLQAVTQGATSQPVNQRPVSSDADQKLLAGELSVKTTHCAL